MNIVALLPYPYDTAPSQRFRLEQWEPELLGMGIRMDRQCLLNDSRHVQGLTASPPRLRALGAVAAGSVRRAIAALSATRSDAVVIHREASMIGPPVLEALIARRTPIIFDLDDAIWLSASGGLVRSLTNLVRMPWKTSGIMRMSAGVSAGNQYLADYAGQFCSTVDVVPTTIDTSGAYRRQKQLQDRPELVVGWSGSRTTASYIQSLLPALAHVAENIPIRVLVVGAEVSFPGLTVECRPWRSTTEVDDLLEMDIGLMPLSEDEWSRGKCGLKALQYMALGIPPIISPVGVNAEIVTQGVNGYHARTDEDWYQAICLLRDPEHRSALGAAARKTVHDRYSAHVGAAKFAQLLRKVVAA